MYMYAVNVCNMSLYILKKEFLSRTLWINKNAKICDAQSAKTQKYNKLLYKIPHFN